jgi:tetratricopeptide (TPR) repeat protein
MREDYNLIVARRFWILFAFLAVVCLGQEQKPVEPPEEDELLTAKRSEYEFNPLQAQKEIKVGGFYMKKGSYRAAAGRFLEATMWDPTSAEAFYKLGEAREKAGDRKGRAEAWAKFLELAPEDKRAAEVKKKLGGKS